MQRIIISIIALCALAACARPMTDMSDADVSRLGPAYEHCIDRKFRPGNLAFSECVSAWYRANAPDR